MLFLRLGVLAAAVSLCSCITSTAPEPAEFKISTDSLRQQYPASRSSGAVELFARTIVTTRDDFGRETHLAEGGAQLVKKYASPILAMAPSILITPNHAEVRGRSTVKKNQQLYIGQDDSTKIIIDGAQVKAEGPHVIRTIAPEIAATENTVTATPTETAQEPVQTPELTPQTKPTPVRVSTPKARPKPAVSQPVAKASPSPAPVTAPPPAAKPQPEPAVDRDSLLKLMRSPSDL